MTHTVVTLLENALSIASKRIFFNSVGICMYLILNYLVNKKSVEKLLG